MGYNKAQSVARAVTMGLGKYIGGTKGAILGGKFGLVGAIPGGMAGYHYGGKGAEYAFDSLVSTKGRKKLKKNLNLLNSETQIKLELEIGLLQLVILLV